MQNIDTIINDLWTNKILILFQIIKKDEVDTIMNSGIEKTKIKKD